MSSTASWIAKSQRGLVIETTADAIVCTFARGNNARPDSFILQSLSQRDNLPRAEGEHERASRLGQLRAKLSKVPKMLRSFAALAASARRAARHPHDHIDQHESPRNRARPRPATHPQPQLPKAPLNGHAPQKPLFVTSPKSPTKAAEIHGRGLQWLSWRGWRWWHGSAFDQ